MSTYIETPRLKLKLFTNHSTGFASQLQRILKQIDVYLSIRFGAVGASGINRTDPGLLDGDNSPVGTTYHVGNAGTAEWVNKRNMIAVKLVAGAGTNSNTNNWAYYDVPQIYQMANGTQYYYNATSGGWFTFT